MFFKFFHMNIERAKLNNNYCNKHAVILLTAYGEKLSLGVIWCAENCKYQADGYCHLNNCGTVNSLSGVCPYFTEKSLDKGDRIRQTPDADKLD